jgi:hypothetical protein
VKGPDRKAAIAAYKERKAPAGIYAVRCAAARQVWVGASPDLDKIQNRLWFGLRLGKDPHLDLQAAWTQYGAESCYVEIVQPVEFQEDDPAHVRGARLNERFAYWAARFGAIAI